MSLTNIFIDILKSTNLPGWTDSFCSHSMKFKYCITIKFLKIMRALAFLKFEDLLQFRICDVLVGRSVYTVGILYHMS